MNATELARLTGQSVDKPGLSKKEFDDLLDGYLTHGTMSADMYAKLNVEQVDIIQTIKRSIKRIASKNHG